VLGLLFGLMAAVGLVLLLDYMDLTVKSPEDLERRLDLPVLGTIPHQRHLPTDVPAERFLPMGSVRRHA
jgi:capsular polysaccharide biosynthesis protein